MRVLALALVLMMLPYAAAWDDPEADHQVGARIANVNGQVTEHWVDAAATGWYPMVDLLAAEITETQDNIQFSATLSGLEHQGTEPQQFFSYLVWFRFDLRGQDMVARMEYYAEPDFRDFSSFLVGLYDPESYFGIEYTSGWPLDIEGSTLSVDMPKRYFRDQNLVPLREGDTLKHIRIWSVSSDFGRGGVLPFMFSGCPTVQDTQVWIENCPLTAKDDIQGGDPVGDFTVELAPEGVGHLLMRADRPWRASNGLATTYLFEVELHNFDEEPDEVLLQAVDIPDQWEVLYPARVSFEGAGSVLIPVAATVPFAHDHGATNFMKLQGQSTKDASAATSTWLGVIFADPPQPAGHHDKLYLHARESNSFSGWMNTVKGIQLGEGDTLTPNMASRESALGETGFGWSIRLDPRLATGLDFLMEGEVEGRFDLQLPVDIEGARVTMDLVIRGETPVELASLETTHTFAADQVTTVELKGRPSADADRVPLADGNMYLDLWVRGEPGPASMPLSFFADRALLFVEEAVIELPLDDYHDEVDLDGLFLNAFNIAGDRTFSYVNPGNTLAFVFNVTNLLSEPQTVSWELTGTNTEWGTVSPTSTAVPASGDGQVVVRVTAPSGALEGDAAELLLVGTSQEDPDRQVFVRLTALVSEEIEVADETHLAEEVERAVSEQNKALDKDSPGFEIIAVIAGLAAVALMLRKKQ